MNFLLQAQSRVCVEVEKEDGYIIYWDLSFARLVKQKGRSRRMDIVRETSSHTTHGVGLGRIGAEDGDISVFGGGVLIF